MTPPLPENPELIPLIEARDKLLRQAEALRQQAAGIDMAMEIIREASAHPGEIVT